MDDRFLFLVAGILACLRAVQHTLVNHDGKLSKKHKAIIDEWWESTRRMDGEEIKFIRRSRDFILKEGVFQGSAGFRREYVQDGTIWRASEGWAACYFVDGQHRDLIADMRAAADWCEIQLSTLEPHLPVINLPGDAVTD